MDSSKKAPHAEHWIISAQTPRWNEGCLPALVHPPGSGEGSAQFAILNIVRVRVSLKPSSFLVCKRSKESEVLSNGRTERSCF